MNTHNQKVTETVMLGMVVDSSTSPSLIPFDSMQVTSLIDFPTSPAYFNSPCNKQFWECLFSQEPGVQKEVVKDMVVTS